MALKIDSVNRTSNAPKTSPVLTVESRSVYDTPSTSGVGQASGQTGQSSQASQASQPAFTPEAGDIGLLAGKLDKVMLEQRAALLRQVQALEEFLGISARTCKHCGRPVR